MLMHVQRCQSVCNSINTRETVLMHVQRCGCMCRCVDARANVWMHGQMCRCTGKCVDARAKVSKHVPEHLMKLREQPTVGCFPKFCFSAFSGEGACGVSKVINNDFFPIGPVLVILIIIICVNARAKG